MQKYSYDELMFPTGPIRGSHPDHLCVMAMLSGISAPPVSHCRVLELACGTGINLIAMAQALPQGRFTGIDLSRVAIGKGQMLVGKAGLQNIDLIHADIAELSDLGAEYDFIILAGAFSWVPVAVQEQMLSLIKAHLAPDGIVYISYLTRPGWCFRGMLRDMLLLNVDRTAEPVQQCRQARTSFARLVAAFPKSDTFYTAYLRHELARINEMSDGEFFHEILEDNAHPCYFHEFNVRLEEHGLSYITDAGQRQLNREALTPGMRAYLEGFGDDHLQREQQMDFLTNRMVRESMLCHQGRQRGATLHAEAFNIASALRPSAELTLDEDEAQGFSLHGQTVMIRGALVKAACKVLGESWPKPIPFATLLSAACQLLGRQSDQNSATELWTALVNGYKNEFIELTKSASIMTLDVDEYPLASPFARALAIDNYHVVNLRHEIVNIDDHERQLLSFLDGKRHYGELERLADVDDCKKILSRLAHKALLISNK